MAPQEPEEKSAISKISEYLFSPFKIGGKKTRVRGFDQRIANMLRHNFRGVIGVIVPLCVITPQLERFNIPLKLQLMWMTMLWFYLVQPVAVPITSLVPVFILPMGGILDSNLTCKSYMNETVMLFVLSGWLIVLLNNSGVDKRIALWFICNGDASQCSGKRMVYKCSTAAFFLSMFSSRLITTYNLTQIMTNAYGKLAATATKGAAGPDFIAMRDAVNNAIQTSSGIGGIAILHSSIVNILFRGCFQELAPAGQEYPDIFNYLQYSAFAFPVAFVMFIVNLIYHLLLVDSVSKGGDMSNAHKTELKKIVDRENATIPPRISLHEVYTVFFALLFLPCVFFRWNKWTPGWADYTKDKLEPIIPGCKDATIAAIFAIILHIIPKSFAFLKVWEAKKKSDVPHQKPESAVLWWRFVDKNINYGYIFTFGSAFAILHAATHTELDHIIGLNSGTSITGLSWNAGILVCVVVASILCNVMTAMAACSMFLPFVLLMSSDGAHPWPSQVYLAALGVGIASNFGFCLPFQYTPAYYCHKTGKVSILTMIKYSILSVIICSIILYLALILYAPFLWDPDGEGFLPVLPATNMKGVTTTTTTSAMETTTPEDTG